MTASSLCASSSVLAGFWLFWCWGSVRIHPLSVGANDCCGGRKRSMGCARTWALAARAPYASMGWGSVRRNSKRIDRIQKVFGIRKVSLKFYSKMDPDQIFGIRKVALLSNSYQGANLRRPSPVLRPCSTWCQGPHLDAVGMRRRRRRSWT